MTNAKGDNDAVHGLSDGDAPFGALSVLAMLLGASAKVKILAALLSEDYHDMNASQIADLAGVHRTTVYDHLDDFEDLDVIVETRSVGGSPMYQINQDSPIVQNLKQLEDGILAELEEESTENTEEQ